MPHEADISQAPSQDSKGTLFSLFLTSRVTLVEWSARGNQIGPFFFCERFVSDMSADRLIYKFSGKDNS